MYKVLYYPWMEPNPAWLRRTLLFVDQVVRIVPEDVIGSGNSEFRQFCDVLPDTIADIRPQPSDAVFSAKDATRYEKAFQIIAASKSPEQKKSIRIRISPGGEVQIEDQVFLHHSKVSGQIAHWLDEYGLINRDRDHLPRSLRIEHFHVVNEKASGLILSQIADNAAKRTGLDTVTDEPLSFGVNSLNAMEVRPNGSAEGRLASALIQCLVPHDIEHLDLQQYKQLRASYADIRGAFQQIVTSRALVNRLDRIQDETELQSRIGEISRELVQSMEAYRASQSARSIQQWGRFSIATLSTITGTWAATLDTSALAATGAAAIPILFEVLNRVKKGENAGDEQHLCRMVCGMQSDVIKRSQIRTLCSIKS